LYAFLSTRTLVSASRVLLSAHRGRSVVIAAAALATVIAFTSSRWTLPTRRESSSDRARPKVLAVDDAVAEHPDLVMGHVGLPDIDGTEGIGDLRTLSRLVSREQLLREVWGPVYLRETQYLMVYAAQLRR
jgi:hypothetical protein